MLASSHHVQWFQILNGSQGDHCASLSDLLTMQELAHKKAEEVAINEPAGDNRPLEELLSFIGTDASG